MFILSGLPYLSDQSSLPDLTDLPGLSRSAELGCKPSLT